MNKRTPCLWLSHLLTREFDFWMQAQLTQIAGALFYLDIQHISGTQGQPSQQRCTAGNSRKRQVCRGIAWTKKLSGNAY